MGYGVRDLTPRSDPKDRARLEAFLANAPRYASLLMRNVALDLEGYNGFWPAALEAGLDLKALGAVENHVTMVWGEATDAIQALADDMVRRVLTRPASSGNYQLVGDEKVIDTYWRTYAKVGKARTVVSDNVRNLYGAKQPFEPPKPDIQVDWASLSDLKVVYAFSGDHAVEHWGFDPRRLTPQVHEAACRASIESGRQLVGRDRGRPVFIAELHTLDGDLVLLDRVHVPRPFRVRKKMVASALSKAAALALQGGAEALMFANVRDAETTASAELAGFAVRRKYRLIVLRS